MLDDKSFQKVLNGVLEVVNSIAIDSLHRDQKKGYLFLLKNCLSGVTVHQVLYPAGITTFPKINSSLSVNDFPTLYAILRTMFETYVNMFYVLIEPKNEDEKEHRLDRWKRHGYSEILRIGSPIVDESKLEETKKKKLELEDKIWNSEFFKNLPPNLRQSITSTNKWITSAELIDWVENIAKLDPAQIAGRADKVILGIRGGFHLSQADFFYSYLSNYTHSEPYPLMQMEAVKSPEQSEKLLHNLPKTLTEMLLAPTLNAFAAICSQAREIINKDSELLEIIDLWEEEKRTDFYKLTEQTTKVVAQD